MPLTAGMGTLLGSAVTGLFGQNSANKSMDFQKEVAQNANQWAAKDMQQAGLNRILALGNPATATGGAQATMPDLGHTAIANKQMRANVKQIDESVNTMKTQQAKNAAEAAAAKAAAGLTNSAKHARDLENDRLRANTQVYRKKEHGRKKTDSGVGGLLGHTREILRSFIPFMSK